MRMRMPGIDSFPEAPESFIPGRYLFQIKGYEFATSKDARTYVKVTMLIEEGPTKTASNGEQVDYEGREFTHLFWEIPEYGEDWKIEQAQRQAGNFLTSFEIPFDEDGFDWDDTIGARAWAQLGPQKRNPEMMEVKRFEKA